MSENRRQNPESFRLTMKEISKLVGGRLKGDGDLWVSEISPVDEASGDQMAFLARKGYTRYAISSGARSFLVSSDLQAYVPSNTPCVIVEEPYGALKFYRMESDRIERAN